MMRGVRELQPRGLHGGQGKGGTSSAPDRKSKMHNLMIKQVILHEHNAQVDEQAGEFTLARYTV